METKEFEDLAQSNKSKQQRFSYDHQKPFTPLESRDPSFLNDRLTKLSSDHLPDIITVNSGSEKKKHNKTFINYKKANWEKFTEHIEKKIEDV